MLNDGLAVFTSSVTPMFPTYLATLVTDSVLGIAAQLLADGSWYGHGEPKWRVFEAGNSSHRSFRVLLPPVEAEDCDELFVPVVMLESVEGRGTFIAYDPRQHPASIFASTGADIPLAEPHNKHHCSNCGGEQLGVALGFEIPSDSESPNDTSWLALSVSCDSCNHAEIVFEDETA